MTSPISLTELQKWTSDHLDNGAGHLVKLADNRENTMDEILRSANGLDWTGVGKEGNAAILAQHSATAMSEAEILRTTASVAKAGALDLNGQKQEILEAVDTAKNAEFEVSDDWEEVKDVSGVPPDSPEGVFRQGLAESIQADLVGQVGVFSSQEMATSAGITSSVAGLGGSSSTGRVQMVDNKTDKGPPPISPDPSKQGGKKSRSFGDDFDSFTKVIGGVGAIGGGIAAIGIGGATEVGTDGVSSPISIPTILGGATAIAGGSGSIEKGLNELFGSGQ
jgi:hypothetical protein